MSGVQSVERALAILREVGREPGGLVDIAERTELPTSTAARLLATLDQGGAVRRDASGVYRIGPEIVTMAGPSAGSDLVSFARRHMTLLAERIGEAVALSIPSGATTTTVEQIDAPKPVRAEDWTGTAVPLHAGCVGLVTLAFWDSDALDDYLGTELEAFTPQTVVEPSKIRARLEVLRRGEMLWTHGEYVDGISSVAAPILNELGQPVAALYSYGPSYRFPSRNGNGSNPASDVFDSVTRTAQRISIDLGWVATDRPTQFLRFGAA